jgi:hypothetical protein
MEGTEDFPDTDGMVNLVENAGIWQGNENGERYDGAPAGSDPAAVSLVDLGTDLAMSSILELEVVLSADKTGGLVFDHYGPDDFKFAAIDADADMLKIGHYTLRSGWVTDAAQTMVIDSGVDYMLSLSLKGTSVSTTVKEVGAQNWEGMVGYVYNAVTVDGAFGLVSGGSTSSFESVTVRTNDPAFDTETEGQYLVAANAPEPSAGTDTLLTEDALSPIVEEAIARLAEAYTLDASRLALLNSVTFEIADFEGLNLGYTVNTHITLDLDAAGHGWFVDTTPADDLEFSVEQIDGGLAAGPESEAYGDMDLLTVVMHELNHVLGVEDLPADEPDLMSGTLDDGVRYDADASTGDGAPLVRMEDTGPLRDSDKPIAASNNTEEDPWLFSWLLDAAGEDDTIGPNSKIKLILPKKKKM